MKKIRSIGILLYLFIVTICVAGSSVVQSRRGPSKMTRQWVDRRLQKWSQYSLNKAQVNMQVHWESKIHIEPGKTYIVMCNHTSYFDIPISIVALSGWSLRMLAKKELFDVPVFGKGMFLADFPMIDRKNRRESLKNLERAQQLMREGIVMWVAPEGTRSTTGELGEFKRGGFLMAIQSKAMIIPMGIQGAQKVWPPHAFKLNLGEKVDVFIGEPIDASEYTLKQKDVLLERVRNAIAKLSGSAISS